MCNVPDGVSTNIDSVWAGPRELLLACGPDRLTTAQLIATVLGTGCRGLPAEALAEIMLAHVGGLDELCRAEASELVTLPGIGAARAARIVAAFHLGRRAIEAKLSQAATVCCPNDIFERMRMRTVGLRQEVFCVFGLDGPGRIIVEAEVARGGLAQVEVHPREVFRPLIRHSAAATILAHNHPSGDPTPSAEDVSLTRRLASAGILLGIPILDHIVVGGSEFRSIAVAGVLE